MVESPLWDNPSVLSIRAGPAWWKSVAPSQEADLHGGGLMEVTSPEAGVSERQRSVSSLQGLGLGPGVWDQNTSGVRSPWWPCREPVTVLCTMGGCFGVAYTGQVCLGAAVGSRARALSGKLLPLCVLSGHGQSSTVVSWAQGYQEQSPQSPAQRRPPPAPHHSACRSLQSHRWGPARPALAGPPGLVAWARCRQSRASSRWAGQSWAQPRPSHGPAAASLVLDCLVVVETGAGRGLLHESVTGSGRRYPSSSNDSSNRSSFCDLNWIQLVQHLICWHQLWGFESSFLAHLL